MATYPPPPPRPNDARPPPSSPPPQWGPPGPPTYPYAMVPPNEPNATTAMVLGILGIALCGVLAPFAWVMGKKSLEAIRQSQGRLGGEGMAQAGYVMGIIGTCLLGLIVLFVILYFLFVIIAVASFGAAAR